MDADLEVVVHSVRLLYSAVLDFLALGSLVWILRAPGFQQVSVGNLQRMQPNGGPVVPQTGRSSAEERMEHMLLLPGLDLEAGFAETQLQPRTDFVPV